MDRLVESGLGVRGLQNRLFMAGPLAEDGVQPKADKQGNEGKDDDGGQDLVPKCLSANIMP